MKKIMFVSFPGSGHINPSINLCKELADNNVKVLYYTFEKYYPKFNGINIELCSYPKEFVNYYDDINKVISKDYSKHYSAFSLLNLLYTFAERLVSFFIEEMDRVKPDLVIGDPFTIWGKAAARYHNIPLANFFCTAMGDFLYLKKSPAHQWGTVKSFFLDFPHLINFTKTKKRIDKKIGKLIDKPTDVLAHQNNFTMVMTSRELHPNGDLYPDNVKFVGPAHVEDTQLPDVRDTIFISIGTLVNSDTFWDICIEATKDLGYKVVISFGGNKDNKVTKDIPSNITIHNNLSLEDYRSIIKKSVLFVNHGGFNSISDAILYRTPLLICPATVENTSNGQMLESYGCGLLYPYKKIEVIKLRKKILEVINNDNTKRQLEIYRQSFLNSMGYKTVVKELIKEFNLL